MILFSKSNTPDGENCIDYGPTLFCTFRSVNRTQLKVYTLVWDQTIFPRSFGLRRVYSFISQLSTMDVSAERTYPKILLSQKWHMAKSLETFVTFANGSRHSSLAAPGAQNCCFLSESEFSLRIVVFFGVRIQFENCCYFFGIRIQFEKSCCASLPGGNQVTRRAGFSSEINSAQRVILWTGQLGP